jgi:Ca2+-binding RTX toxin-like protein
MDFLRTGLAATLLLLALFPAAARAEAPPPQPSCAEGPTTVGRTTLGTPCDDVIHAAPGVATVYGGEGDDTIVAAPIAAGAPCTGECLHLGVGSQTFNGGPGNDVVFGERGNDTLNGNGGDDSLYGGIGDDRLRGGPGNDLLSGGFGADSLDGEEGNDFVRGDATLDRIFDSGGGGVDTLSYATGVTPGFNNNPEKGYPVFSNYTNFPSAGGERGVYLNLTEGIGDNGIAPDGGGVDGGEPGELVGTDFETIIGTPFSDFIVGSSNSETIYGGGGADVILGEGGNDHLYGGADGDHLDGGSGEDVLEGGAGTDSCEGFEPSNPCETTGKAVAPRDGSKVSVGLMAPQESAESELYMSGSGGIDKMEATYAASAVTVELLAGSEGAFDTTAGGGCNAPIGNQIVCPFTGSLDSIVLAGLGGDDTLSVTGFPDLTSIVELGGEGEDTLTGGNANEDVLADGPGNDHLAALGGDDAVLNNEGTDALDGGTGSDLLLSNSLCDGDLLNGGAGEYRDNASWTKLKEPVAVRLDAGVAGRPLAGQPSCAGGGSLDHLQTIEDLEGTNEIEGVSSGADIFYGDANDNQLLGHKGADSYFALAGDDTILANSGDSDLVIDCGEGTDTAFIDIPTETYADPPPVGCETVYEAEPNSFQPPGTPTGPQSPATATPSRQPVPHPDRTPPRTRILHHPPGTVFTRSRRRTVSFSFASNEANSTFRCRLDRKPFKPCRSPRRYSVRLGRHTVRIFAVDAAGNRDRSPAAFSFRVRRR